VTLYEYRGNIMARFKDFGAPQDSTSEALSFKIYEEEFFCHPAMQGKVMLDFIQKSDSDRGSDSAEAILLFFKKVLVDESYVRFQALTEDPERIVSVQILAEIVGWILEEYSGRPTQGPENSPAGA
jgi:hypothetical protein